MKIVGSSRSRGGSFLHYFVGVAATMRTVPFALWFGGQLDALEVEPLDVTGVIVAADHLAVGDLATHTINRLVFVIVTVAVALGVDGRAQMFRMLLLLLLRTS